MDEKVIVTESEHHTVDHSRGQSLSKMMDDSVFSLVVDAVAEEGSTKCETVKTWWYLMSALSWTE